jgi:hypothetical protein
MARKDIRIEELVEALLDLGKKPLLLCSRNLRNNKKPYYVHRYST